MPESQLAHAKESNQSLERGLAVLQVLTEQTDQTELTLAEVARLSGTTRATARRILLTLEALGHVHSDGRRFSLAPRVLALGWAYLSALNLSETALPIMRRLSEATGESCSLGTLDVDEVVFVARVPTRRIMAATLGVGSRLPAFATAIGRVLLASRPDDQLAASLRPARLTAFTPDTLIDPGALQREIGATRARGWAIVDGELEAGLRAVAAPIDAAGSVVAALNVSAAASRVSRAELEGEVLPRLLVAAREMSEAMATLPHGFVSADPQATDNARRPRRRSRDPGR